MSESSKNIKVFFEDTIELYFDVTDENGDRIDGDDWDSVVITIKDDFSATDPVVALDEHAGEFVTFESESNPGNIHFFMTQTDLAELVVGFWEYRVILEKDVVGENPAQRITAAQGKIYVV